MEPFFYKRTDAVLPLRSPLRVCLVKAEEVSHSDAASQVAKITNGNAVSIGRAKQCPDTRAHDDGNRDLLLLEDFEDP